MEDYLITHIGEGYFQIETEDGIKEAGSNLCGMIRYTYFEDYTLPEIGWNTTRLKLLQDYMPKMQKDVLDGKLNTNQINL